MGVADNKKNGMMFTIDYKKQIVNKLGLMKGVESKHCKDLSAADRYAIEQEFDKLTDKQVASVWPKK